MKNTLIIPCSDTALLDGCHRLLAKHPTGESVFLHCISGFCFEEIKKIIVILSKKDNDDFLIVDNIKKEIANIDLCVEFCILDEKTFGPADTVYKACKHMNVSGPIIIKDSHSYVDVPNHDQNNFVVGINIFSYGDDITNLKNKSFIVANENNIILDIIEKRLKSDVIGVGVYGFENVSEFYCAYEALIDSAYGITKLYFSHIVSYLIGAKRKNFYLYFTNEYESYASQKEWNFIKKRCAKYLIDIDLIFDESNKTIDQEIVEKIIALQKSGAELFFCVEEGRNFNYIKLLDQLGLSDVKFLEYKNHYGYYIISSKNDLYEIL